MRAGVEALGADAEIARRAGVPQEQVGRFRNGYEHLSAREAAAAGAAVAAIKAERAAAAADNVVHFPIGDDAGGDKVRTARAREARRSLREPRQTPTKPEGPMRPASARMKLRRPPERLPTPMPMVMVTKPMPLPIMTGRREATSTTFSRKPPHARRHQGAKAIIEAAVLSHIDPLKKAGLCITLKKALGRGFAKAVDDVWSFAEARLRLHADELAAAAAAASARNKKVKQETERARLWPLVEKLANRRDLIEHVADIVQAHRRRRRKKSDQGELHRHVVAPACRTSCAFPREHRPGERAGKSWLMYTVARIFPAECVIEITTGSPKAMMYISARTLVRGRTRSSFWRETAGFIASSDTQDNPSAAIFREFLTGGAQALCHREGQGRSPCYARGQDRRSGLADIDIGKSQSGPGDGEPDCSKRRSTRAQERPPAIQHAQLSGEPSAAPKPPRRRSRS